MKKPWQLTRSPYLFMAIENGLMPMKNLWLLSSIILLFFSQMTLLCMSSCTEETLVWIRADLQPLRRLGREMQSQRHHFVVGYAVVGLPDLPLRQDGLVRVWNHWLWAAQQDDQQSCCQQQESAPLTCRGQAHHSWESQMFVPTQKNMLLSQFLNCSDNYSFNIGTLDWSSYCWLWSRVITENLKYSICMHNCNFILILLFLSKKWL